MTTSTTVPTAGRSPIAVTGLGVASGAVAGIGLAVLLQQYGVRPMTVPLLLGGVLVGALIGIVLPSLGRALASDPGAAPTTATPTASTTPVGPTVAGWTPTHVVPATGTWAWSSPDPATRPATSLSASTGLQLLETSGNWFHVQASNGWQGWVDGRQLTPHATPPTTRAGAS